jgi:hypothetical protein
MRPEEYRQLMTMSDEELLAALRQMVEQAGSMLAAQSLDLIERLRARAEKAEAQLRGSTAALTPSTPGVVAKEAPQRGVEPYTCRYCGSVTASQNEARARLCLRCVRFEGDVHPAVTKARIAAHNARISDPFINSQIRAKRGPAPR